MVNNSIPRSQSSLGFFGIIKESFKTSSRNGKLLRPILLLVFISFCLLEIAHKYVIGPVSKDLMSLLAKHPNMFHDFAYPYGQPAAAVAYPYDQPTYAAAVAYPYDQPPTYGGYAYDQPRNGALKDVREILLAKMLFMAVSSIITLVFLVATVSSSYEAYTAKLLDPKDVFLKLRKTWKTPIVTSFYMILLTLGIAFFYMISIGITSILAVNSYLLMFLGAITLSIPVCYFYVVTLWMVSLVVSVLEEGSSGLKAIGRAAELMKGKRLQASLMMFLFAVVYGFVALTAKVLTSYNRSLGAELAFKIPLTNGLYCLLNLFMLVVYTVFYHEQKTSHDEKEVKSLYLPIAAGEA